MAEAPAYPRHPREKLPPANHPYHGYCQCGACVWDSPYPEGIPLYRETITCWNCGADNSRRPSLGYRLRRWYYRQVARRLRGALRVVLGA